MDSGTLVTGIAIMIVIVIGAAVVACVRKPGTDAFHLFFGPIRKGDVTCRDCGTQMVEQYPNATGARRYFSCRACGYFDSYLDRERVAEYQRKHP